MTREIKFRAFQDNQMLVSPISSNYGLQRFFGLIYEDSPIMQFTGMKDRDGNEIYEGDIFKLGVEKDAFEVRFVHGCFMAYRNEKQIGLIGELKMMFIKVIGNIHQNPELLCGQ